MVNDSCLFCFVVLILGVDKGSPEGVGTLEVYLNVSSFTQSFEFVSSVGDVGNNNGGSELVAVVLVVVGIVVGIGNSVRCMVGMFEFVFPLVECPFWELAVVSGCFDV